LELALLQHFPRKVIDPELDAEAVIDEFHALFSFLEREFDIEGAGECRRYIETTNDLAKTFAEAMQDESYFGMAKSLVARGKEAGFDMESEEDIGRFIELMNASGGMSAGRPKAEPYEDTGPDVGRNDPCPCGSGKKYKKCCLRKQ
jgi:uncharacterized protein YecA (UPF0149 family)